MKLSIIIPVYNEEQTIGTVVERVRAVDLGAIEKEIIIANDGSDDGSEQSSEQASVRSDAKHSEKPAAEQATHDAHENVAEEPEPAPADRQYFPKDPAEAEPADQYGGECQPS